MDPKQTAPQGNTPAGGKEGQKGSPATTGANPVFSFTGTSSTSSSPLAGPSVTSKNEPGTLGAETLSTGANVSRTMDSLNSRDQATHGGMAFAKHRFDKIDPKTGDILLTPDEPVKKPGFFSTLFGKRKPEPESVSMVENRHKDVVIPAEYQNPGKKRGKKADNVATGVAVQAEAAGAAQAGAAGAVAQNAPQANATQAVVQPNAVQATPGEVAVSGDGEKKSRKGIVIALAGVLVVVIVVVVGVVVGMNMSGGKKSSTGGGSSGESSDTNKTEDKIKYYNTIGNNVAWIEMFINNLNEGNISLANFVLDTEYPERMGDLIESLSNLEEYVSQKIPRSKLNTLLQQRMPEYNKIISFLVAVSNVKNVTENVSPNLDEIADAIPQISTYAKQINDAVTKYLQLPDSDIKACSNDQKSSKCREIETIIEDYNGIAYDSRYLSNVIRLIATPIDYKIEGTIYEAFEDEQNNLEGINEYY